MIKEIAVTFVAGLIVKRTREGKNCKRAREYLESFLRLSRIYILIMGQIQSSSSSTSTSISTATATQDAVDEKILSSSLQKLSLSSVETVPDRPKRRAPRGPPVLPPNLRKTTLVFDARCLLHSTDNEFERPERLLAIHGALSRAGFISLERNGASSINGSHNCCSSVSILPAEYATENQLLLVHSAEYLMKLRSLGNEPLMQDFALKLLDSEDALKAFKQVQVSRLERIINVTHPGDNPHTPLTPNVASLAAGGACLAIDSVCGGYSVNSMALVRPPGHHCHEGKALGFCYTNNAAVAARHAQAQHGVRRVAIVDWDVHAGDGTQSIFESDESVLVISIHRGDIGFFPAEPDQPNPYTANRVGTGKGAGFTVNIPWSAAGAGDCEYAAAFQCIVFPILSDFDPELIIVSCGFDAAEGDPLGGCHVTPPMYGALVSLLGALDPPRGLVLLLEGGYSLTSISASCEEVVRSLVDLAKTSRRNTSPAESPESTTTLNTQIPMNVRIFNEVSLLDKIKNKSPSVVIQPFAVTDIKNVLDAHAQFWPRIRAAKTEGVLKVAAQSANIAVMFSLSLTTAFVRVPVMVNSDENPLSGNEFSPIGISGKKGGSRFLSSLLATGAEIFPTITILPGGAGSSPAKSTRSALAAAGASPQKSTHDNRMGGKTPTKELLSAVASPPRVATPPEPITEPVVTPRSSIYTRLGWKKLLHSAPTITVEKCINDGSVYLRTRDSVGRSLLHVRIHSVRAPTPIKSSRRSGVAASSSLASLKVPQLSNTTSNSLATNGEPNGIGGIPAGHPLICRYLVSLMDSSTGATPTHELVFCESGGVGADVGGRTRCLFLINMKTGSPLSFFNNANTHQSGTTPDDWRKLWVDASSAQVASAVSVPDMISDDSLPVSGVALVFPTQKSFDSVIKAIASSISGKNAAPIVAESNTISSTKAENIETQPTSDSRITRESILSDDGALAAALGDLQISLTKKDSTSEPLSPETAESPLITTSNADSSSVLSTSTSEIPVAIAAETRSETSQSVSTTLLSEEVEVIKGEDPEGDNSGGGGGGEGGGGEDDDEEDESATSSPIVHASAFRVLPLPLPPSTCMADVAIFTTYNSADTSSDFVSSTLAEASTYHKDCNVRTIQVAIALPKWTIAFGPGPTIASIEAKPIKSRTFCVLTALNENAPRQIASLTKIMTAIIVLGLVDGISEALKKAPLPSVETAGAGAVQSSPPLPLSEGLATKVVISREAASMKGTSAKLREGDTFTVHELLYAMLLPSGNDAAQALAEHIGSIFESNMVAGSPFSSSIFTPYGRFVAEMNRAAKALGLSQCNFKNPHGLAEEGSNSCALDAARLSAAAMSDARFATIVACKEYEIKLGGRRVIWENTNTYLGDTRLAPGTVVDGVKTGITPGAQACLVLHAQTDKAAALAALNAPKWKLDAAAAAASELAKSKGGTMSAQLVVAGYAAASKSGGGATIGPPGSLRIDEFFSVTLGSKNKAMRYLDNAKLLSWAALSVLKLRDPTSAKSVAESAASSGQTIKKSLSSSSSGLASPKGAVSEILKLASAAAKVSK